jgi:hypothetical protein
MRTPVARASKFRMTLANFAGLCVCCSCLLAPVSAHAVDCDTSDGFPNTRLENQTQVDNFQTTYGGGGTCDTITRDLIIEGGPFTNLFGLASIVSITGDLQILRSSVDSLEGLSNLANIGGILHIESQLPPLFSNLNELSSLTSLDGLDIEDTNYLYSLSGLSVLANLRTIRIFNARILTNLTGLPPGPWTNQAGLSKGSAVDQVAQPAGLYMIESISISGCDELQTLEGLSAVSGLRSLGLLTRPASPSRSKALFQR